MLVKVLRSIKTKFRGLRVKFKSRNINREDRDQNCQNVAKFDSNKGQAARLDWLTRAATQAQMQNSFFQLFGSEIEVDYRDRKSVV